MMHTDPGFRLYRSDRLHHRPPRHPPWLHDRQQCLIGMGAIVLNGARIGDDCLIGAGALVPEGREIPAGSLVLGMPGKAVRPLTADEIGRNRISAAHYVANWKRFAKGLNRDPT